MASVASQLIEEVTAHAQSDNLEDAREICADSTYFPNNLHIWPKYKQFLCYYKYSYNKYFNQASDLINLLTYHH